MRAGGGALPLRVQALRVDAGAAVLSALLATRRSEEDATPL